MMKSCLCYFYRSFMNVSLCKTSFMNKYTPYNYLIYK